MGEQEIRGSDFEERLLVRLKAVVAERDAAAAGPEAATPAPAGRGPRRRRPLRLALAGAAVLLVLAVVLIVNSGGDNTSKAFAVEPQQGGGVTIKVYSLEDAAGLEAALESAGIQAQVNWLAAGTTCRERRLTPSSVKTSMGARTGGFEGGGRGPAMTIAVMTPEQYRHLMRESRRGEETAAAARESIPNISLDPRSFRPDQTVIITGSPIPLGGDPEGGFRSSLQVVEGPVEACRRVPAAASSIGAIDVAGPGAGGNEGGEVPAGVLPGPGQFLYAKTKVVQLQGWEPDGRGAGPRSKPRRFTTNLLGPEAHARPAFVPADKEVWTAPDGTTRVREALGRIKFLSSADQRQWEEAGSPPPFAFDPREHPVGRDRSGRLVKDFASRSWRGHHAFSDVPKLYRLPTEPEALRLAIEGRAPGAPPASVRSHEGGVTAERLLEILGEPLASPALRAAAFGALAELPGIGRHAGASDVAGRRGVALTWDRERGFGNEVIFDPRTSTVLAEAEVIFGPPSTDEYGVPAHTAFRETAYLGSGIVDSDHESAGAGRG